MNRSVDGKKKARNGGGGGGGRRKEPASVKRNMSG